jgi:hypothetical protein
MAHFAKLGIDNVVTAVVAMDTITTMTRGGIEKRRDWTCPSHQASRTRELEEVFLQYSWWCSC